MKKLTLALGLVFVANAHAMGGFNCSYDDGAVKLEVSGSTTHGFESALVSAETQLTGALQQNFSKEDFMQYWSNDGEFRLALYAETDTSETIVRIKTQAVDDIEFKGTVHIEQGGFVKDAPITCELE